MSKIVVDKEELEEILHMLEEAIAELQDPFSSRELILSSIMYAYSRLQEMVGKPHARKD
ncbi:MAG: hypothetical protein JHC26_09735 [Thermofilum sp.]|jgi:hypothetical protein|uniref:hypothetical protein n=1 Tax=Thermofilum sp. TaxID=1961369 RepID=UPI00258C9DB5|nr:hypothetical protein [Thermofilum sp.]MCI4409362.1 hypothetical protein [Thermofilum sp.]